MYNFVFVFDNEGPIESADSILVQADDLQQAIDQLILMRDGSKDPQDYIDDIEGGNIIVLRPISNKTP